MSKPKTHPSISATERGDKNAAQGYQDSLEDDHGLNVLAPDAVVAGVREFLPECTD